MLERRDTGTADHPAVKAVLSLCAVGVEVLERPRASPALGITINVGVRSAALPGADESPTGASPPHEQSMAGSSRPRRPSGGRQSRDAPPSMSRSSSPCRPWRTRRHDVTNGHHRPGARERLHLNRRARIRSVDHLPIAYVDANVARRACGAVRAREEEQVAGLRVRQTAHGGADGHLLLTRARQVDAQLVVDVLSEARTVKPVRRRPTPHVGSPMNWEATSTTF